MFHYDLSSTLSWAASEDAGARQTRGFALANFAHIACGFGRALYAKMQTARTMGKAAKLAGESRCLLPLHTARKFHALNNSHFCESLNSCGYSRLGMVYSIRSRMSCCFTFAAEGHANTNSLRVDIPKLSSVSRQALSGVYPSSERTAFCCNVLSMKAPHRRVQSAVHCGQEFSACAQVSAPGKRRDAVCANQQQQLVSAWAGRIRPVCVPLSVRYNPL